MARPSKYQAKFAKQARKLCELGATDQEIADFFDLSPSEDDWLLACLLLIRQDRRGVFADQKKERSHRRRQHLSRSSSARIRNAVQARMWAALKGRTDGALFSRLGYTVEELMAHLERQFTGSMSWGNYGRWHIDHIRPCSTFDLTDEGQFAECWALGNLAPLWATDNCRKGASYVPA